VTVAITGADVSVTVATCIVKDAPLSDCENLTCPQPHPAIAEIGRNLQFTAKRLNEALKGGKVKIFALLQPGYFALGLLERFGEFFLRFSRGNPEFPQIHLEQHLLAFAVKFSEPLGGGLHTPQFTPLAHGKSHLLAVPIATR